jgi:hypothetical protein
LLSLSGSSCAAGYEYKFVTDAAVAYINDADFMKSEGFTLQVSVEDDESSDWGAFTQAQAVIAAGDTHAIIGPATSSQVLAARFVAAAATMPIVSFGSTSPSLNKNTEGAARNGDDFLVRTIPTDTANAKAIIALIRHFEWRQFGMLSPNSEWGNSFADAVESAIPEHSSVALEFTGSFNPLAGGSGSAADRAAAVADIDLVLGKAKEKNLRIFCLFGDSKQAALVLQRATLLGMTGKGWVWIAPAFAWMTEATWELSLPGQAAVIERAMDGMIGLARSSARAALVSTVSQVVSTAVHYVRCVPSPPSLDAGCYCQRAPVAHQLTPPPPHTTSWQRRRRTRSTLPEPPPSARSAPCGEANPSLCSTRCGCSHSASPKTTPPSARPERA